MGLFEEIITPRRLVVDPIVSEEKGNDSFMKVIVGLGNPGREYDDTRHNIGFRFVDELAKSEDFSAWKQNDRFKAMVAEKFEAGQKILLVKPQTFMNLSGDSLQSIKHFYKCNTADFVVIHDELDLPLGTVRINQGGNDAGHNGVKSIIGQIDKGFWRIRVGIGPAPGQIDTADFVLGKLGATEKKLLPKISDIVLHQCQLFTTGKIENSTITI